MTGSLTLSHPQQMHFGIQYILPDLLDFWVPFTSSAQSAQFLSRYNKVGGVTWLGVEPILEEMQWFPDLANVAFCETVELRRKILHRQSSGNLSVSQGLEPSNAEFIAALAAGNNCHRILQVGCGISTVALAAAAQATGGFLLSIHADESKQDVVRYHMNYLGLLAYVEFLVASESTKILLTRANIDFAHLSGDPKDYIQVFDSLNLSNGAVVAAENALNAASNEYIQHVRRQPGMESSTLPFARGLEVTKLVSWEKFEAGRIFYSDLCKGVLKEREPGSSSLPSAHKRETTALTFRSVDAGSKASLGDPATGDPKQICSPCEANASDINTCISQFIGPATAEVDAIPRRLSSFSDDPSINSRNQSTETTEGTSVFKVSFRNYSSETRVTITGANRDMLLSDITAAFSEMGISVKRANIETRNDLIKDTFYVVNAKSRGPLHPSQWNLVREKILESIGKGV